MATITYTDLDGSAPETSFHGVTFRSGKSVTVDDDTAAGRALVEAARVNPWFDVGGADEASTDTPFARGVTAARDDKARSVPPAYRGKSEGEDWLKGYDSIKTPS